MVSIEIPSMKDAERMVQKVVSKQMQLYVDEITNIYKRIIALEDRIKILEFKK